MTTQNALERHRWSGQTYCLGFVEEQPLNALLDAFANATGLQLNFSFSHDIRPFGAKVMTRGDKLMNDARSSLKRVLAGPDDNCPSQFRPPA